MFFNGSGEGDAAVALLMFEQKTHEIQYGKWFLDSQNWKNVLFKCVDYLFRPRIECTIPNQMQMHQRSTNTRKNEW